MKKIACMLAAGVFAFGATAKADQVASTEYAVITIPVHAGNNLIGISVEASDAALMSVITGLPSGAGTKKWTGSSYSLPVTVGELYVSKGDSFFVDVENAVTAYELGVAPSEATSVTEEINLNMDIVAPPFANDWSLSDLTFGGAATGGSRISVANKVHVWNGAGYDTYWYKKGTSSGEWRNKVATNSVPASFGAGQSFFVEFGNGTSTKPTGGTVTFAVP